MYQYVYKPICVCVSMYLVYVGLYQYVSVVNMFQYMSVPLSIYQYEPISVRTVCVPGMCQCVSMFQYVPVSVSTVCVPVSQ